jgi:hypothetical protein
LENGCAARSQRPAAGKRRGPAGRGAPSLRPAQEAGNAAAFGPAATANEARASNLHGRSPDGATSVRRSRPVNSGSGIQVTRGVRRAERIPDPAPPRLQAGKPARRPPLPNETKN